MDEINTILCPACGQKRPSINRCLLVLGAPRDEIYIDTNAYRYPKKNIGSIYNRHSRSDLLAWAKYLYKKAMVAYHPDRYLFNKDFYTARCQVFGKAYNQAKKILTN